MCDGASKELTERIIGAAIEAHRELGGPGLLEKIYEAAFCRELASAGLAFKRQCECPIFYKGEDVGDPEHPLKIDVLVENRIVVECKAVAQHNPVFAAQCLTYLRLKGLALGLVINFGLPTLVQGVERIMNPVAVENSRLEAQRWKPLLLCSSVLRSRCQGIGVPNRQHRES